KLADATFEEADASIDLLDPQLALLRRDAQAHEKALASFATEPDTLVSDPALTSWLADAAVDVDQIERIALSAEAAASEADRRAATHESISQAATADVAHLDETGTA